MSSDLVRERGLAVAALGALAASVGDFGLLYAANAPALGLPAGPRGAILALGAALGVLGIPLYGLGYAAAAMRSERPLTRRAITGAGIAGAILGALIHGATALVIRAQLGVGSAAAPAVEPLSAIASQPGLVVLWGAAAVCVLAASAGLAWLGVRGGPRAWLLLNPAVATALLLASAAGFEMGRWFVAPMAPNLAHLAFFGYSSLRPEIACSKPVRAVTTSSKPG